MSLLSIIGLLAFMLLNLTLFLNRAEQAAKKQIYSEKKAKDGIASHINGKR